MEKGRNTHMSEPSLLIREKDGVLVVSFGQARIAGELFIQQLGNELQELVVPAVPGRRILLDFSGVDFMSSLMIGQILRIQKQCRQGEIRLKLCNLSLNVSEVFKLTGLTKLLEIHADAAGALEAFERA
jgi:anti-sigma B factor antagonist